MSDANVQVVRQLYAAMGTGNLEAVLALLTDDVTFVVPGPPGVGAAGTWQGHSGVRECFARLQEAQENQSVEIRDIVAQGDKVVVLLHVVAKSRTTGKTFESGIVHFYTVRDGRVAQLLDFFDTAAYVAANHV